ncbi:MAG: hypothetical protein ACLUAL_01000 [Blautia wexlerae]
MAHIKSMEIYQFRGIQQLIVSGFFPGSILLWVTTLRKNYVFGGNSTTVYEGTDKFC